MKNQRFIIICAILFLLERIMPFMIPFGISVFPAFAIYLLAVSKNFSRDMVRLLITSVFFDVFSGLPFGYLMLALIMIGCLIYMAKRQLKINEGSFFSSMFILLIFVIGYLALFTPVFPFPFIVSRFPMIVVQYLAVFAVIYFFRGKLKIINTR